MKNLLWIPLLFICGFVTAPILQQKYTTNTAVVVDNIVSNQVVQVSTLTTSNLLVTDIGWKNGNLNGGADNFFFGNAGNIILDGSDNIALGTSSQNNNLHGNNNVSMGASSLSSNTNSGGNVAIGGSSLLYVVGAFNTGVGLTALEGAAISPISGNENIGIGHLAGWKIFTGSSNICIGNIGVNTDTNIVRIGDNQSDIYLGSVSTTHVSHIVGSGDGVTNVPKIFTVTNTSPANTTSLAQATIWLVITNQGVAYKVPAF